jgi:RecB family exonuclease
MSAPSPLKSGFTKQSTETLIEARERINEVLDLRARQWSLFEDHSTANTAVQVCTEYPSVLSPSSLNCFLDCQVKWFYRKVLGLPERRTLALGLGSAVHEALGANFKQKIETKCDLPLSAVKTVFRDSFEAQLDQVTLSEDDDIADAKTCGDVMLGVYMEESAPRIEPAAVERPVSGEIGGVPVSGFIDVLDVHGNIIDVKTSAKRPVGFPVGHRRQVTTYAMLEPRASGTVRLDTLTKTKTVALHSQTMTVGADDRRHVEKLYSITLEQMRSGLVVPNRGSFLCSRKHCSYWEQCQADYGGVVE